MEKSLEEIARELRGQYLIAYETTNGNYGGKYRQVEMKLPNHRDLRFGAKKGYMAVQPRATGSRK